MANLNVVTLPKAGKPRSKPAPRVQHASVRSRLAVASASAIGMVAVGATALSLSDLAESIQAVAHCSTWKAFAFAAALDANFIATESFSLFATAAVARATERATAATKVITLALSAVANSWAMAHDADGAVMQAACVVAGCAVPGLIALATYTLGRAVRA
ncbi:MAG TPA: hypothetical protein VKP67_11035 [Xanthobacteraceae bacterium]|nr:hypothetical protein [Xanthobacteraceae bacterium]